MVANRSADGRDACCRKRAGLSGVLDGDERAGEITSAVCGVPMNDPGWEDCWEINGGHDPDLPIFDCGGVIRCEGEIETEELVLVDGVEGTVREFDPAGRMVAMRGECAAIRFARSTSLLRRMASPVS